MIIVAWLRAAEAWLKEGETDGWGHTGNLEAEGVQANLRLISFSHPVPMTMTLMPGPPCKTRIMM